MTTASAAVDIATDFKAYHDKVTAALLNLTRSANAVAAHDISFHRSSGGEASSALKKCDVNLLSLTNRLLKAVTKESSTESLPTLKKKEHVEDNWRKVVDVVDDLLEKADASLDEFNGLIKRMSPQRPGTPETPAIKDKPRPSSMHANILRPQTQFERKVDNFDTNPWKPLLSSKPHAMMPLEQAVGSAEDGYKHPYAFEIENSPYPEEMYREAPLKAFTWPQQSPDAIWVDTEEGVHSMLEELKTAKEIAVDLEHNDKNSYVGMVCLMQISTRDKDWIVDTLRPWREHLQVLNEVFTDPNIVKVFHGSNSDIIWLQRDLGLYVVGLFDTYHASSALNLPHRNLAFLLNKYTGFVAQKQFQLADWRVRPLPQELIDYARCDTHFLLYVYDCLRNALVKNSTPELNLVDYVVQNSRREALQVYERTNYDPENGLGPGGWLKMLIGRNARSLDREQFAVFRLLHEWRDRKAREQDEGEQNIMPNIWLWNCAQEMPVDLKKLFEYRLGRCPNFVVSRAAEVVELVKRGKEEGRDGPSVEEVIKRNEHRLPRRFQHSQAPVPIPSNQTSMAATMQRLVKAGDLDSKPSSPPGEENVTEVSATRANRSSLWGALQPRADDELQSLLAAQTALQNVMPIPATTTHTQAESIAVEKAAVADAEQIIALPATATNGTATPTHTSTDDEIFTLNERKKKRKMEDLEDGELDSPEPTDSTEFIDLANTPLNNKAAAKAAKKARKAAAKAEKIAAQANFQPFDYAGAPSLMHTQPEFTTNGTGTNRQAPMNPFAKALDTGTGARRNRMGKEMAGKSHTFKS